MFELYDKVTVSTNGSTGVIIDVDNSGSEPVYTVESDTETSDEFGTLYPLFYCRENEMKKIMTA